MPGQTTAAGLPMVVSTNWTSLQRTKMRQSDNAKAPGAPHEQLLAYVSLIGVP
jgi:hypothetical protein